MDERAVRAAVDRLVNEAHGLYEPRVGEPCRFVPVSALDELVKAIDAEPPEPPERAD